MHNKHRKWANIGASILQITTENRVTNYNYDSDGNTTGAFSSLYGVTNSRASYTYDEENRLTSISDLNASGQPNTKYEFVYDGMSRLRISRYYARNGSGALTLQNETRRVYDGMDVVQERDQNNVVNASYTRTGNIGGILARTSATGTVFYGYDGGGNVVALTNNAGAQVGSYTYDAFGNTVATSGNAAIDNPYRFSTKEQIGGLYSYGLRFYSPGLGRWINRDPIAEAGGVNLYGFVGNDPVDFVDSYGMIPMDAMTCHQLRQEINTSVDELRRRIAEQRADKNNLFILWDQPNPNGLTGNTTWVGHRQGITNTKNRLSSLWFYYVKGNCANKTDNDGSKFPGSPGRVTDWLNAENPTEPSKVAMNRQRMQALAGINLRGMKRGVFEPGMGGLGVQSGSMPSRAQAPQGVPSFRLAPAR